jgi:hypothetical protein
MIAPISAGTVSLLMMGFAWGAGTLIVPIVGMVADRIGIERTLAAMAVMPLAAAALAWPLPDAHAPHVVPQASAPAAAETPGTDVAR